MHRLLVVVTALAALASSAAATTTAPVSGGSLRSYVRAVEPIRLGVNDLLEGADPILTSFRDHQTTGDQAAAAMDALERRFAEYTLSLIHI